MLRFTEVPSALGPNLIVQVGIELDMAGAIIASVKPQSIVDSQQNISSVIVARVESARDRYTKVQIRNKLTKAVLHKSADDSTRARCVAWRELRDYCRRVKQTINNNNVWMGNDGNPSIRFF